MSSNTGLFIMAAILLQLAQPISSAKILGYLLTPSRSHFIIHDSLMKGLAAKGHDVTVLSIYPEPKEPIPNYRFYQVTPSAEDTEAFTELNKALLQTANVKGQSTFSWAAFKTKHRLNVSFLRNPVLERLKREEHFDLVVFGWMFNDYQLGIAAHFQCPSVVISGTPALTPLRNYVGNPSGIAYADSMLYAVGNVRMTFKQRIIAHVLNSIEIIVLNLFDRFLFESIYAEHFPATRYPSYTEAKKNVSLVMVSSHFSQGIPIATFPGLIEISGIQIKKTAHRLPDDIQAFLDGAQDGAIFMSFGSNINSAHMVTEKREAVVSALGKLKQRILWKWEDDKLPNRPDNIMIGKWLPQDDILAHPNVRLFISHCGRGSVNEARSHGVPVLAIPMIADQLGIAEVIVNEGWAVKLVFGDLTEESLMAKLKEMWTNPKYLAAVTRSADLYNDRPAHPLDTAVFWVEYVLRNKGAKHMQSQALHLSWFQMQSLDVIAFLLAFVYIGWKIFVFVVKFAWRNFISGSKIIRGAPKSKKHK